MDAKVKNTMPVPVTPKKMRCLGINLPKHVQGLSAQNYKTTMKEVKEDLNKQVDISCSWIARVNIVKMSLHPRLLYRFEVIGVKTSARFLCKHKASTKIHMERHRP